MSREQPRLIPGSWSLSALPSDAETPLLRRLPAPSTTPSPRAPGVRLRGLAAGMLTALAGSAMAQNPLPPGALPCVTNEVPANYGTFLFVQGTSYLQTGQGTVTEAPEPSSFASIQLVPSPSLTASNGLVSGPGGFRAELQSSAPPASEWSGSFATASALDAAMPPGAWSTRLDIALREGPPFLGFFRFAVGTNTPPIPRMNNAEALAAVDSGSDLALTWNAWANATPADRVHLEIRDANETPVFSASTGCGGEFPLTPGATNITVPAGRLAPRTSYTGHLTFGASTFAIQDRPTLLVERGVHARTLRFALRTTGPAGGDVVLSAPRLSATGSNLIFTITGTPRSTYLIQFSSDLLSWTLERVATLQINGSANLSLPLPPGGVPGFWRAVPLDAVSSPPSLQLGSFFGQNRDLLQITVEGTPGVTYRIEWTSDLMNWVPLTPFGLTIPTTSTRVSFGAPFQRGTRFTAFRALAMQPR